MKVQKGVGLLIGMIVSVCQFDKWPELKQLLEKALQTSPDSPATLVLLNTLLSHFTPPVHLYEYLINAVANAKNYNLLEESMNCLVTVS